MHGLVPLQTVADARELSSVRHDVPSGSMISAPEEPEGVLHQRIGRRERNRAELDRDVLSVARVRRLRYCPRTTCTPLLLRL